MSELAMFQAKGTSRSAVTVSVLLLVYGPSGHELVIPSTATLGYASDETSVGIHI